MTFKNMYSVVSLILCKCKSIYNILTKMMHVFLANTLKTFRNCSNSKSNVFSFGGKCIQSPIQYVFSRYSVLPPNVFSHLFSFEGKCIQFCELILVAISLLPFEKSLNLKHL